MNVVMDPKTAYLAEFARTGKVLPGTLLGWLQPLRESAINCFGEIGFPDLARDEDWRFTDITPILDVPFRLPTRSPDLRGLAAIADGPLRSCQLTFVNGRFVPELSSTLGLADGVRATSLATMLTSEPGLVAKHLGRHAGFDRHPFVALNTAFFGDGAFIHVPRGVISTEPIHVLFISLPGGEPMVTHPRALVLADEGTQATIVQSYISPGRDVYFTNAVTEMVLGPHAVVDRYKLQRESNAAFHLASLHVHQARASNFQSHAISFGAAIARDEIHAILNGEGAECTLNGLYEATGDQVVDNQTTIDHATPHGTSRQLYKGVLNGRARGVFNGKIFVRPGAQKTDAVQENKNLLLSDDAVIDTKPQLEIFADDVKCKHGATIGQLDLNMLFYLRSRGIGEEAARRLLIHAFASEILDQVKVEPIRAQLGGCLLTMVPAAQGGAATS